jgi:hypothetical protein
MNILPFVVVADALPAAPVVLLAGEAALAVALVGAVLPGALPVLGWLLTLLIVAFGFGVFAVVAMVRWSARDTQQLRAAEGAGEAVAT